MEEIFVVNAQGNRVPFCFLYSLFLCFVFIVVRTLNMIYSLPNDILSVQYSIVTTDLWNLFIWYNQNFVLLNSNSSFLPPPSPWQSPFYFLFLHECDYFRCLICYRLNVSDSPIFICLNLTHQYNGFWRWNFWEMINTYIDTFV